MRHRIWKKLAPVVFVILGTGVIANGAEDFEYPTHEDWASRPPSSEAEVLSTEEAIETARAEAQTLRALAQQAAAKAEEALATFDPEVWTVFHDAAGQRRMREVEEQRTQLTQLLHKKVKTDQEACLTEAKVADLAATQQEKKAIDLQRVADLHTSLAKTMRIAANNQARNTLLLTRHSMEAAAAHANHCQENCKKGFHTTQCLVNAFVMATLAKEAAKATQEQARADRPLHDNLGQNTQLYVLNSAISRASSDLAPSDEDGEIIVAPPSTPSSEFLPAPEEI